jgi:DNA-binding NarL/FixJ family response regulator
MQYRFRTQCSGKIRVLLADDHHVVRRGLTLLLQPEPDVEVVAEAPDGAVAVRLARQHKPDIVLMDISMPVMDGIQATRIIRSELPDVCVIGLSMFQAAEQAKAMIEAGARDYLVKTSPADDVLATIRDCARNRDSRNG